MLCECTRQSAEDLLLGVLTGLIVALVAIYCYCKVVGHVHVREESGANLTATTIWKQSMLLGVVLRRRNYTSS